MAVGERDVKIVRAVDGERREDVDQRGPWRGSVHELHNEALASVGRARDVQRVACRTEEDGINVSAGSDLDVPLVPRLDPQFRSSDLRALQPSDAAVG